MGMEYEKCAMFELSKIFSGLARGNLQVPKQKIFSDIAHKIDDKKIVNYIDRMILSMGPLFSHFVASIPYVMEELARIGVAMARLQGGSHSAQDATTLDFYELDAFDGTNAKTLASFGDGRIKTLTSSPNPDNSVSFYKDAAEFSRFISCPFFEVTLERMTDENSLGHFKKGFDVVYEMAAFQFYGPERQAPIQHIKKLLKPHGIVILLEKLICEPAEYEERERVKDNLYKSRYFTEEEIAWKKDNMLKPMQVGQVSKQTLTQILRSHFKYVYQIWHSTNFYEFAASNDDSMIMRFLENLGKENLPDEFRFEDSGILNLS
jgi:SAM-dependent methyltransferase